eukprot:CAMPEP_0202046434 /NCGR_PEP_ID=MMETSP0963-20130614/1301_1 /ASSEMBLY_ACC=CAM_ASM_000494 /TAXON_ID=4773 /ORGANISM="Schizochytrium aggregatum, Strain ATCC28209" /LENGTH=41 /DNA_ID= /DNA_START= /DNA_END= /DNA_ORIENTATION=
MSGCARRRATPTSGADHQAALPRDRPCPTRRNETRLLARAQ